MQAKIRILIELLRRIGCIIVLNGKPQQTGVDKNQDSLISNPEKYAKS